MVNTSRRRFILASLGIAGSFMLGSLMPRNSVLGTLISRAAEAEEGEHLPYEKIDPEVVRERGYINYFKHMHCGEGAFRALAETLAEVVGGTWTEIAKLSYVVYWGHGGGVGFCGTCGALIGAASIINLAFGRTKLADKLIYELFRWYELYPFPQWTPPDDLVEKYGKVKGPLPTSVSYSILCHVSVTRWCLVAKKASGSPERSERCARLTGEVAAKAVELMNAAIEGKFRPSTLVPLVVDEKYGCRKCHRKKAPYEVGGWTRGKMYCLICHPAPHLKALPKVER